MVLRKEIKLGLGIGAAVLGIALVYGLMAMLSANSRTPGEAINTDANTSAADGTPADTGAVAGLPPKDDASAKPPARSGSGDPFAESARNDGNKNDPWAEALSTGKVPTDTGVVSTPPSAGRGNSVETAAPVAVATPGQSDISGPIVTQVPTGVTTVSGPPRFTAAAAGHSTQSSTLAGTASAGTASVGTSAGTSAGTAPATGGSTYTVQAGDTFTRIAAKLYGDRRLAAALIKANPNIEPTRLRTGVAITVPAKDEVATARGSVAPAAAALTGTVDTSREYRVVAGDTLHRIATKLYGRAGMWESIYDGNKSLIGADPGRIKIGQVLKLPVPPNRSVS